MDRSGVFEHPPKEAEESGLALMLVAELVASDQVRMAAGESVMSIVQVRTVPSDAQPVQPGRAELGLETLSEVAFGLWVQVNASSDVHSFVRSLSLMSLEFGRRNG